MLPVLDEDRGVHLSAAPLPQGLEPALAQFASGSATGWLVATNGRVQKRIAFENGAAVFAVSNDPKDLMGQALLRAGLISERDLAEALAMPRAAEETTPHLLTALVAMKKVTPDQTKAVFELKLRESVLDLFLWSAGSVEAHAAEMGPEPVFPTRIPVEALLQEGPKRRSRWTVVRKVFPSFEVAFERKVAWPDGFPATPGDKKLATLIERGQSLAQILLELHGQDYAIAIRVTNLFQKGILATRKPSDVAGVGIEVEVPVDLDVTEPRHVSRLPTGEFTKVGGVVSRIPAEEPSSLVPAAFSSGLSSALLERANALLAEKKFEDALSVLTELVQNDPLAAGDAWALMNAVEAAIVADAEATGLVKSAVFTLARPLASLSGTVFPPEQAFVLSRFAAGKMSVGELTSLCPFPPVELYRVLRKFLADKIIRRV